MVSMKSEHNYAFILIDQKHLIKFGRMIYNTCNGILVHMVKASMDRTTAYKFVANEARENKNLDFILHNCHCGKLSKSSKSFSLHTNAKTNVFLCCTSKSRWLIDKFLLKR